MEDNLTPATPRSTENLQKPGMLETGPLMKSAEVQTHEHVIGTMSTQTPTNDNQIDHQKCNERLKERIKWSDIVKITSLKTTKLLQMLRERAEQTSRILKADALGKAPETEPFAACFVNVKRKQNHVI